MAARVDARVARKSLQKIAPGHVKDAISQIEGRQPGHDSAVGGPQKKDDNNAPVTRRVSLAISEAVGEGEQKEKYERVQRVAVVFREALPEGSRDTMYDLGTVAPTIEEELKGSGVSGEIYHLAGDGGAVDSNAYLVPRSLLNKLNYSTD